MTIGYLEISMFKTNRVFSTINTETGSMKWYFQAREGRVGPFDSKQQAVISLKDFIQDAIKQGESGGRRHDNEMSASALHVQSFIKYGSRGM